MADKFRRKKEPRHIRLYHSITGCEAWRHLSGNAMKVLLALARFDDGNSNGQLYFSERTGATETGLSRNTVRRSIAELIDKGFIAQTKAGAFNRNNLLAATYRLTWVAWPGGKPSAPTREFEKWKHGNSQAQILTRSGANFDPPLETDPVGGANIDPPKLETWLVPVEAGGPDIEPQVLNQGHGAAPVKTDQRKRANPDDRAELAFLRETLADHLKTSEPGEQTDLARRLGIPGSTLSKFINGRNLPDHHAARLATALRAKEAA